MLLRGRIFMGIFTEMTHKHEINLGKVSNNICIAKYRMNTYLLITFEWTNCMTCFSTGSSCLTSILLLLCI